MANKLFSNVSLKTQDNIHLWRELMHNKFIFIPTWAIVMLTIIQLLLIGVFFQKLPTLIPFWYSKPWGPERLASPYFLFLLPFSNLFWYLVNAIIASTATKDHLVFSQVLFLSAFFITLLSTLTLINILWIIL